MVVKTMDSTLAYFVNQLDNLDRNLHEPLYSVTWSRDIKLREGVSMANESTSFVRTTFGATGALSSGSNATGGGKNFIAPGSNTIPGIDVNGERIVKPLRIWGQEVSYTSIELDRSQLIGQPVDAYKMKGMTIKYNMDIDEMVYVGDTDLGVKGLVNSTEVTFGNVALNAGATSRLWTAKTPDEILADVNALISASWAATGYAVCPSDLLLPPAQFAYLSSQKVSTAGNVSILTYLEDNSISLRTNGKKLNIQPVKWLVGAGAGATDRMVAYTNDGEKVRFPMVPVRRETAYYFGIRFSAPYIAALGEVEFVYPETVQYADGF